MKKLFFMLALILAVSWNVNAQTRSKSEFIATATDEYGTCPHLAILFSCDIEYDDTTNLPNYSFWLGVQNDKYECVEDFYTLIRGTAQEVYDFLNFVEIWGKNNKEDGISEKFENYDLRRHNFGALLGKHISVYSGDKHHTFRDNEIKTMKKRLIKYCKKHNIVLTTE